MYISYSMPPVYVRNPNPVKQQVSPQATQHHAQPTFSGWWDSFDATQHHPNNMRNYISSMKAYALKDSDRPRIDAILSLLGQNQIEKATRAVSSEIAYLRKTRSFDSVDAMEYVKRRHEKAIMELKGEREADITERGKKDFSIIKDKDDQIIQNCTDQKGWGPWKNRDYMPQSKKIDSYRPSSTSQNSRNQSQTVERTKGDSYKPSTQSAQTDRKRKRDPQDDSYGRNNDGVRQPADRDKTNVDVTKEPSASSDRGTERKNRKPKLNRREQWWG